MGVLLNNGMVLTDGKPRYYARWYWTTESEDSDGFTFQHEPEMTFSYTTDTSKAMSWSTVEEGRAYFAGLDAADWLAKQLSEEKWPMAFVDATTLVKV